MRLGRVIGQVVCSVKDPELEGRRFFVMQGLDAHLKSAGNPYVAVDGMGCAGPGDVVYLCFKRDAAIALGDKPPVDACILGYVDEVVSEDAPGGPMRRRERYQKEKRKEK